MTHIEYLSLGKDWVTNFIKRHPHLQIVVEKTIESSCIQGTMPDVLQKWFDVFQKEVLEDPEVLLEDIYNMDKSRFCIRTIKAERIIINAKIWTKLQAQPGCQGWITVIECVCVDGTMISMLIIFKGENLSSSWIPSDIAED